jgi:lipopolysaccharide/colanic/teichoic acid biosynthesis glycosyltransferase
MNATVARSAIERIAAGCALFVFAPLFGLLAAAILFSDGFPIFFRQLRVGLNGRAFHLLKFRSMAAGSCGKPITAAQDSRVTWLGAGLRRYKLDELPQLWNVVRGDMSLIGPRPEVPAFVDQVDPRWQVVLSVRPGITDLASLVYRDEERLLGKSSDVEQFYRETILPDKLAINAAYLRGRSHWTDAKLICLTIRYSFFPSGFNADRIRKSLLMKGAI